MLGGDPRGPRHDERDAHTTRVGRRLVQAERRVRGHSPPARVVHQRLRAADQLGIALDVEVPPGHPREPAELLEVAARARRPALLGGSVVGGEDDHRVVEVAQGVDDVEQPGEVLVDVVDHRRVHLHVPGEEGAFLGGVVRPGLHLVADLVVPARERGPGREEPELELAGEASLPNRVPAHVVAAPVAREVGRLGVERPVDGTVREVEEEGTRRVVGAQLLQVPDRLVGDVVGEVVALGVLVDVHRRVVAHQVVGLMEVRPSLQHPVVALEPALERPRIARRAAVHRAVPRQVPLADRERRVARGAQRLGERLDRGIDLHRPAGEARVEVRDRPEPRPVRVHPGLDGCS